MGREFASPGTYLSTGPVTDRSECPRLKHSQPAKAASGELWQPSARMKMSWRIGCLVFLIDPPRISLRPATCVAPTVGKGPTAAVWELLAHPHVHSSAFLELLVHPDTPSSGFDENIFTDAELKRPPATRSW